MVQAVYWRDLGESLFRLKTDIFFARYDAASSTILHIVCGASSHRAKKISRFQLRNILSQRSLDACF